jgi:hypothetical protein
MSMNDWRSNAPFPLPDLSPRAAPATGPRDDVLAKWDGALRQMADGAVPAARDPDGHRTGCAGWEDCKCFPAPASPPPEPAEERHCKTCGDTGVVASEAFVPDAPGWAPESKPCPDCPAEPAEEPRCSCAWTADFRDHGEGRRGPHHREACPMHEPAPALPRPEESALDGEGYTFPHLPQCDVFVTQGRGFLQPPAPCSCGAEKAARALSAPPPGEERLRERIEKIADEWEQEALRRDRDAASEKTASKRDRLILGAGFERNHADALRAALREDEKGAKP